MSEEIIKAVNKQLELKRSFDAMIEQARQQLAKFKEAFEADPHYALAWSKSSFEAAAQLRVFSEVAKALEKGTDKEKIAEYAANELVRRAGSPEMSTSPTSNLLAAYETAAWAKVAETFKWHA